VEGRLDIGHHEEWNRLLHVWCHDGISGQRQILPPKSRVTRQVSY
jgi:hypothetical protein